MTNGFRTTALQYKYIPFIYNFQSYLWDNDTVVAEWVESQMQSCWSREAGATLPEDTNTTYLTENLQLMKRDAAISQVKDVVKVSEDSTMIVTVQQVYGSLLTSL